MQELLPCDIKFLLEEMFFSTVFHPGVGMIAQVRKCGKEMRKV